MTRTMKTALTAALALSTAGCLDLGTSPSAITADDFALALAGYGEAQSSYSDGSDGGLTGFVTGGFRNGGHRGGGFWMMGGGMAGAFAGHGLGQAFGHRPIDNSNCTFNSTSNRLECAPVTRAGLTITRSFAFADADGAVQQAFDSTTYRINTRSSVVGTITGGFQRGFGHGFRHGMGPHAGGMPGGMPGGAGRPPRLQNDTTTVNNASDRTVSGLRGSARIVNGISGGTETTVGTDSIGRLTIVRVAGDTTTGVTISVPASGQPYPTAGTIVRSMRVTLTYDGQAPTSSTRREVITFDGSTTATVTITRDGTTRNCTLPLPRGRLTCS